MDNDYLFAISIQSDEIFQQYHMDSLFVEMASDYIHSFNDVQNVGERINENMDMNKNDDENDDIENDHIENDDIENDHIENDDIENDDIENDDIENVPGENQINNDSYGRFFRSIMDVAIEGQNAYQDDPESIPGQIFNILFNQSVGSPPSHESHRDFSYLNLLESIFPNYRNFLRTYTQSNIMNFMNFIDELSPVRMTMNIETIESQYPVMNYSDIDSSEEKCSVCLNDFGDNDDIRVVKCRHIFHVKCIDEWLLNHSYKCPICRSILGNACPNL